MLKKVILRLGLVVVLCTALLFNVVASDIWTTAGDPSTKTPPSWTPAQHITEHGGAIWMTGGSKLPDEMEDTSYAWGYYDPRKNTECEGLLMGSHTVPVAFRQPGVNGSGWYCPASLSYSRPKTPTASAGCIISSMTKKDDTVQFEVSTGSWSYDSSLPMISSHSPGFTARLYWWYAYNTYVVTVTGSGGSQSLQIEFSESFEGHH